MALREILRFELAYQGRRLSTWLYFIVLLAFAILVMKVSYLPDARTGRHFVNAPFVIAAVTVFGSVIWLLMAASVAGDAAARDVQTRMHPLVYTAPISKVDYLGGRFLAAFLVDAALLLAVPIGLVLAVLTPDVERTLLGPFRPVAFLVAYGVVALPTAFAVTAIQFSAAVLDRRPLASYIASVFVLLGSHIGVGLVANAFGEWYLAKLLDPIGITGVARFFDQWPPARMNDLFIPDGWQWLNRLIWLTVAACVLALTSFRFRFGAPSTRPPRRWRTALRRLTRRRMPQPAVPGAPAPVVRPEIPRTFGFATHTRQTLTLAWTSFGTIVKSRTGLTVVIAISIPIVAFASQVMAQFGVPTVPTTGRILRLLTATIGNLWTPWIVVPLLIVYFAGELVWRERDAGISEIADAAPVAEWSLFTGKFLGLALVIVVWMAIRMAAALLIQMDQGYREFEPGLLARALFGLQFLEYLLFALLALVIHALVNQKYVGHLVALLAFGFIAGAGKLGIDQHLLVYGSAPAWSYSDMRRFEPSLRPWLWLKIYWTVWALLLAVSARLLWPRGRDQALTTRLRLARARFTQPAAIVTAAAVAIVIATGAFIFYNARVAVAYHRAADRLGVEYERRYGQQRHIAQPQLTATNLQVELFPKQRAAEIRGTYTLENRTSEVIPAIHVTTSRDVETGPITFDRSADAVTMDEELGYRIYALQTPLQPGESLRLQFQLHHAPRGFLNSGADAAVVANGAYITNDRWMPAIGYQRNRELDDAAARITQGLPPRRALPALDDAEARKRHWRTERTAFDATVATDADQVAIAPGALRRTWTDAGRSYFHYATDAPITNVWALFSAKYTLHETQWDPPAGAGPSTRSVRSGQAVTIRIYQHPGHTVALERMVRGIRAGLDYFTKNFGPYPYSHLTIVERGSHGDALNGEATEIDYGEGFALINPRDGANSLDLVFFAMAHEVSHQWWGHQVSPASAEGAALLGEGLANYSAMQVLEKEYGHDHLERYLQRVLWASYEVPRSRAAAPLLRADNPFLGYRKGAHALYGLSRYIGEERMNTALHRLIESQGSGATMATTLDLYRELKAVTPESFQPVLHDLFEANTFWELATDTATAKRMDSGDWQVTLDVRARKVVADAAGNETEMPMDDWVEIGVFDHRGGSGRLYGEKHRIHSGAQTITVTVPASAGGGAKPALAGIDPGHLLIDWVIGDNVKAVQIR